MRAPHWRRANCPHPPSNALSTSYTRSKPCNASRTIPILNLPNFRIATDYSISLLQPHFSRCRFRIFQLARSSTKMRKSERSNFSLKPFHIAPRKSLRGPCTLQIVGRNAESPTKKNSGNSSGNPTHIAASFSNQLTIPYTCCRSSKFSYSQHANLCTKP